MGSGPRPGRIVAGSGELVGPGAGELISEGVLAVEHIAGKNPRPIDYGQVPVDTAATLMCSGITAYGALKRLYELDLLEDLTVISATSGGRS